MTNKWHEEIICSILDSKTDILFIIDPSKVMDFSEIRKIISEKYPTIVKYDNELKLRRILRKKEQKILIVFRDKNDIPFDLISTYATIDVNINDIFPLLSKDVFLNVPYENYQEIYEEYNKLRDEQYERLSKSETKTFIENVLRSDTIGMRKRLSELSSTLNKLVNTPLKENKIKEWARASGELSNTLGELMFIIHDKNINLNIEELQLRISNFLKKYAIKYDFYNSLAFDSNSLINSNIISHIFKSGGNKYALICFDCMGFEEWYVIKEYLERRFKLEFDVNYSFSMLPSETNHSSSALFAGMSPKNIRELDFIDTVNWRNEEKLFKYTLHKKLGIDKHGIYFKRCVYPREISIDYDSFRDFYAIGFVFSFIDRITHSMLMDKRKLISNIRMHLEKCGLENLVASLLDQDFHVYFVSDHGSVFSKGNGINVKKDLVDEKAKRYLISDKKELLEEYRTEDSEIIQLKNILGNKYLLLLTGAHMFAGKKEEGLTHGGLSIEEVVVPFIEVKYNDRV